MGDVRNVSGVKFTREEEGGEIGECVKLVTDGATEKESLSRFDLGTLPVR